MAGRQRKNTARLEPNPRSQFTERFDLREKGPSDTPRESTPPPHRSPKVTFQRRNQKKRGEEEVKKDAPASPRQLRWIVCVVLTPHHQVAPGDEGDRRLAQVRTHHTDTTNSKGPLTANRSIDRKNEANEPPINSLPSRTVSRVYSDCHRLTHCVFQCECV